MYNYVIQQIIQEELEKKKIEKEKELMDNVVLYIEPPMEYYDNDNCNEEEKEESNRGVVVIDIA